MKHFHILFIKFVLSIVTCLGYDGSLYAREVESFRIREGTIEPVEKPHGSYLFRSSSGDELFDLSGEAFLRSKKAELPNIPGLREIGFKLNNGAEYLYRTAEGGRTELATAQAAAAEHPGKKVASRLFQGEGGSRLEIAVTGLTPVFRTDVKIGGRDITLWANRKPEVPAK